MAEFYDTHAHLDDARFSPDLVEVIARAETAGIVRIISIGTDLSSSERAIQLAEQFSNVYAAVGWHPSHALEAPADVAAPLRALAQHPKVVAIGETGLDYYRLPSARPGGTTADDDRYKKKQADIFRQQLALAAECGLNCVIHERNSFADTIATVEEYCGRVRGVFHCFAGDRAAMQRVLAAGSIVSFTGIVTFKNGQNIRDTLAATPLGQFMLETDCPYLTPEPHRRRKRSEPADVKEISDVVMQVKGCTADELSVATCNAARGFFPKLA